jgi:hypothetical protein
VRWRYVSAEHGPSRWFTTLASACVAAGEWLMVSAQNKFFPKVWVESDEQEDPT